MKSAGSKTRKRSSKVREEMEKEMLRKMRGEGMVRREHLDEEVLGDYPEETVDEELKRLWKQSVISRPSADYVRLHTDPRSLD